MKSGMNVRNLIFNNTFPERYILNLLKEVVKIIKKIIDRDEFNCDTKRNTIRKIQHFRAIKRASVTLSVSCELFKYTETFNRGMI